MLYRIKNERSCCFVGNIGFANLIGSTGKIISSWYGDKYPDITRRKDSILISLHFDIKISRYN